MIYGYLIMLAIIVHNNVNYNILSIRYSKINSLNNNLTNLLKTKIAIINNLTDQIDQVKTINNILLLQQLDNNQVLFNDYINLTK
jgi:hypothetical protein